MQALAGIRRERVQAVANWLGTDPGAQLCGLITEVNYGDREETPLLKADFTEPEEPLAMAERDQVIVQTVPVPKNWYYLRHNVPVPRAGEETIGGAVSGQPSAVSGKAPDISGAAQAETKVETELDAMRVRLAALEAMNDNHSKANGQFISGPLALDADGLPKRMSVSQADELLTKGVGVTDDQGRGVQFGQRLKTHIEHHSSKDATGRKEDLAWGVHTVISGQSRDIVFNGQPQRQYVKLFTVKDGSKGFTTIVDSKDGEAFRIHQVPARKIFQAGYERQTDGQPSERAQQALYAAADRLSGCFEYNQYGEIVNFMEAVGAPQSVILSQSKDLATALAADFAPFTAKYGLLLTRLQTALAMHPEPRVAELAHLKPELEAMVADMKTAGKVLAGSNSAELLEKMLSQSFFNALATAKAAQKETA